MATPTSQIIFLTGAPAANALRWDEGILSPYFIANFRRFLGHSIAEDSTTQTTTTPASHSLAKWRSVPMPGYDNTAAKRSNKHPEGTQFLSFRQSFEHDSEDFEHKRFLEHSLGVLQGLDSSQIEMPEDTYLDDTNTMKFGSFDATITSELSLQVSDDSMTTTSSEQMIPQTIVFNGPITDLSRIPYAPYLQAIQPQTMTVNILAAVITVKPPRIVQIRRRDAEMEIIEVMFGDETRANFTISFWLVPVDSQSARTPKKGGLREALSVLRSGDIVIATHIALNDFNGTVYGNSLSRRRTRNNTTLIVLSGPLAGLAAPAASKLSRVRNWSKQFVGGTKRASSKEYSLRTDLILPVDTQPYG